MLVLNFKGWFLWVNSLYLWIKFSFLSYVFWHFHFWFYDMSMCEFIVFVYIFLCLLFFVQEFGEFFKLEISVVLIRCCFEISFYPALIFVNKLL